MSDTLDLAAIKARAEAATPEPWRAGVAGELGVYTVGIPRRIARTEWGTDAEHIAGMDPPTTLALVAEVERLRAVVERTGAALAKPLSGVARVRLARHALGIARTAETTR